MSTVIPIEPKISGSTRRMMNSAAEIESLGMLLAAVSGDVEQPDAHRIGAMISNRAFDIKAHVEEINEAIALRE